MPEYYAQCNCFCGCSEMCGPSMVPLHGHVECLRCHDGECTTEHYDKSRLEMVMDSAEKKLQVCELAIRGFEEFTKIFAGPQTTIKRKERER